MVTHVMSDGTKRQSIDGYVIPTDHPVYKAIQKQQEAKKKETRKKQERVREVRRWAG